MHSAFSFLPSDSLRHQHRSPSQCSLYGFPILFTVTSEHIRLFTFQFFCFYTFLVVGSVRQIKLTYVGFRARVKIASRIVSYRIKTNVTLQCSKAVGDKTTFIIMVLSCTMGAFLGVHKCWSKSGYLSVPSWLLCARLRTHPMHVHCGNAALPKPMLRKHATYGVTYLQRRCVSD